MNGTVWRQGELAINLAVNPRGCSCNSRTEASRKKNANPKIGLYSAKIQHEIGQMQIGFPHGGRHPL